MVVLEHGRQIAKFGFQTRTAFEWLTYMAEELGELAGAIAEHEDRNGSKERVVAEAIQVATLGLKVAEMFGGGDGSERTIVDGVKPKNG